MAEQRHTDGLGPLVGATSNPVQQEGGTAVRPQHAVGSVVPPLDDTNAEERERRRARTRGVPESQLDDLAAHTAWYISNRVDDRVVIYDRDPLHPGGEVFIGGSGPARAYRTGNIERLLMSGEILEVPEPIKTIMVYDPDSDSDIEIPNPKRPIDIGIDPGLSRQDLPGQPTRLGRRLDPDLWEPTQIEEVARRQNVMPKQIAAAATMPRPTDIERGV